MIPVRGCVKNYHWGKVGEDNHIARFQAVAPQDTPTKAYQEKTQDVSRTKGQERLAELWFGSHPSGPSMIAIGDRLVKLDEFLAREPEMVGAVTHYFKYNKQLPFLLKILSIAQPLSLQAHPDKKLAQVLHKRDPENYPDANHKPELAIALTEFHVLCDFRPHVEIAHFIKEIAPLKQIIGQTICDQYLNLVEHSSQDKLALRKALCECFKSLMTKDKEIISKETKNLLIKHSNAIGSQVVSLVTELDSLYPGDPGVFTPFFLNYFKLSPGQAIYLRANKLHAYLRGECIECMACSDNVVRAALTTKYRDTATLIEMLDYEPVKSHQDLILPAIRKQCDDCTIDLFAPTDEFKVEKIVLSNKQEYTVPPVDSGSFLIVLNGKATTKDFFDLKVRHKLTFGFSGFVPPKVSIKLADIQGTLIMYRAFC